MYCNFASRPGVAYASLFFLAFFSSSSCCGADSNTIRFDRQIRPILNRSCIRCHGADAAHREAGLRLDFRESAEATLESGNTAIVPRNLEQSALWRRIISDDPDTKMPPTDEMHQLSAEQIETFRKWIEQGAEWEEHWSFLPVDAAYPPRSHPTSWALNPIDQFVLGRLKSEGLSPSPAADRAALLRRVTFDLTGVPPTRQALESFLADESIDAYERVVERLLSSPRYGERFATPWLDAARYSDTNGHFMDNARQMWAWRDWVVQALNKNMPFDQFSIEQIAGDLLPSPSQDQLIASGFHRNHGLNFEAGAIDEECRVANVIDRINTTGVVWLGLTLGCAQCHDHKYDPISQEEYYQLYAFFNNIDEEGVAGHFGNAKPMISLPSPEQKSELDKIKKKCEQLEARRQRMLATVRSKRSDLESHQGIVEMLCDAAPLTPVVYFPLDATSGYEVENLNGDDGEIDGSASWGRGRFGGALAFNADCSIDCGDCLTSDSNDRFTCSGWVFPTTTQRGTLFARMDDEDGLRGLDVAFENGRLVVRLAHDEGNAIVLASSSSLASNQWRHVAVTYDGRAKADSFKLYVGGVPVELQTIQDNLNGKTDNGVSMRIGRRYIGGAFEGMLDEIRIFDKCLEAKQVRGLVNLPFTEAIGSTLSSRSKLQNGIVLRGLARVAFADFSDVHNQLTELRQRKRVVGAKIATVMVMQDRDEMRPTYLLARGSYAHPQKPVSAGTPAFLPSMPAGAPANRLGFAQWLFQPDHPLTSRVAVNRAWQHFFGAGIVASQNDFGVQGAPASHPMLLDWLAVEFRKSGWDLKALHRLIATSATYRQSSIAGKSLRERDPNNRLLARMSRRRLTAEMIRDAALAYSGLITSKLGGPGVNVYQPAGLWKQNSFLDTYEAQQFVQSHGESLYRRSLYIFWKRTCPPPAMTAFDAPSREYCSIDRARTNTPIQALVLLNDPTYIEAARRFAATLLSDNRDDDQRIQHLFRTVLSRGPLVKEERIVRLLLKQQRERYRQRSGLAVQLLSVGESSPGPTGIAGELAAWTIVVSTVMNLDEAVTRN